MSVPFGQFNADLIGALVGCREVIERKSVLSNQWARLVAEGGHLLRLLPLNFAFDERDYARLAEAAPALVNVQTKLIRHLASTVGREGMLRTFRVPEGMRRFVNWGELLEPETLVARFDILQAEDGYRFCEFNIDSCVAAAEIFEFAADYFDELGISVRDGLGIPPPLEDLAASVARLAARKRAARIVILDWSVGGGSAGKGYLSFERMRGHVARAVAPVPVFIADEKSYDPGWLAPEEARRTLVYRGFMMDEMDDGGAFLDTLLALGTPVVNTYESEIRMNKVWFALFHDEALRPVLSRAERELIARYIPYTCEIDERNRASLIEHKDGYVFKEKQSFGGSGIRIGESTSAEELSALLRGDAARGWTAQELVRALPATFPHDESFRSERQNLVFGMYLYGARANGMLVRASTRSKVVNVTAGDAKLAWAVCVDESTKARIVAGLAGGAGAGT